MPVISNSIGTSAGPQGNEGDDCGDRKQAEAGRHEQAFYPADETTASAMLAMGRKGG